ncbi:MAG TPA: tetratricopeptide repeat protein [Caulobacteraceae bacterium]|nr:tetratricopeptide repeat protein [Caulobacteraceae bacterium]
MALAITQMKAAAVAPLLDKAVAALQREDAIEGGKFATEALNLDEMNGFAWYLLAISRERLGDFKTSIQCYESALKLLPDHAHLANDIGRLAYRLDMKEVAVKLFRHFIAAKPDLADGPNNLACALRDLNQYEEAIDVLKPAIAAHPANPLLWNTLGSVLSEQGDLETAIVFFDEALRLNPGFSKARYNRGNARLGLGRYDQALADCDAALAVTTAADEKAMMRLARSTILLCQGRVGEGWDDYEARLAPEFSGVTHFLVEAPKWTPDSDIAGQRLLYMGEQGLGDEILFSNIVPDLIEDLGPNGRLTIAVEPRLVSLFQRSFPAAEVGPHATYKVDTHLVRGAAFFDPSDIDLWTPMASPLRRYRRSAEAFPNRQRFLIADEARVAHWREVLKGAPPGLKVGLLWKSMKLQGARQRQFSPFEAWAPVLKTPGVSFINLQYGDCSEELAMAREELGVDIWTPPGIDLKQDLDDLAALSCALDVVLGFANATSNIAAACGAKTWLIAIPGAWVQAGTGRYPWYPQARVFNPQAFHAWGPVMAEVAQALALEAQTEERNLGQRG